MSFAIHVEYLTGYAVAQSPGGGAEWPPHPARLFMALVAAVYETGGETDQLAALRWLEQQAPPTVIASGGFERSRPDVFVPPNDDQTQRNVDKITGLAAFDKMHVLPQYRTNRQPRTFARFRPDEPTVTFAWDADPGDHADALAGACAAVARLGHSASLVRCWLDRDEIDIGGRTRWEPDEFGEMRLRVTNDGSLQDLDERFNAKEIEAFFARPPRKLKRGETPPAPPPRLRPAMRRAEGYRKATGPTDAPGTVFDPRPFVFTLNPMKGTTTFRFLSAAKGPDVCVRTREALLSKAGDDAPPILSGHKADGSLVEGPHVAVVPLIDAGHRHARGHLLGLAIALPKPPDPKNDEAFQTYRRDRKKVIAAMRQVTELKLGPLGVWSVAEREPIDDRHGLRSETWTAEKQGAVCWATVTPISLDRHAKAKDAAGQQEEIAGIIRLGCGQIGLPEPVRVVPFPVSPFLGAPNGYEYPRLPRKDGSKRRQAHAMLWFREPVAGPVLLGAGRYRGWGVCRPYREEK